MYYQGATIRLSSTVRYPTKPEKEKSGPGYWGLMNPQWNMCSKGRRQSPINVEPDKLLFDPFLRQIHLDKHKVSGMLHNTGQSLVFRVDKDTKNHVNISGGPLAYRYQFEEIYIHYGIENDQGSEHHIHGYSFPGEETAAIIALVLVRLNIAILNNSMRMVTGLQSPTTTSDIGIQDEYNG
ncbi:hypothetical protein FQR65_LT02363 [Abscondita terminalis]|nr:hypothetical protein FQR65_LT02363 [Abscondita terminalis]